MTLEDLKAIQEYWEGNPSLHSLHPAFKHLGGVFALAKQALGQEWRDVMSDKARTEIAGYIETAVADGLDGPRDLDCLLDAISQVIAEPTGEQS